MGAGMDDVVTRAKKVRLTLCIGSVCTFDKGCGCLDAITALISERDALAQKVTELTGDLARTTDAYESACNGRGEFRAAYREARTDRDSLAAQLAALAESGHEVLQCLIDHAFEPGEDPRISDFAYTIAQIVAANIGAPVSRDSSFRTGEK